MGISSAVGDPRIRHVNGFHRKTLNKKIKPLEKVILLGGPAWDSEKTPPLYSEGSFPLSPQEDDLLVVVLGIVL